MEGILSSIQNTSQHLAIIPFISSNAVKPTAAPSAPVYADIATASIQNEEGKKNEWISAESITHCSLCNQEFSITKRKHHCRACGKVVCNDCSASRLRLPQKGYTDKVRLCDSCFAQYSSSQMASLTDEIEVKENMNIVLKKDLAEKFQVIEQIRTFLLEVENCVCAPFSSPESENYDVTEQMRQCLSEIRIMKCKLQAATESLSKSAKAKEEMMKKLHDKDDEIDILKRDAAIQSTNMLKLNKIFNENNELKDAIEAHKNVEDTLQSKLSALMLRCEQLEAEQAIRRKAGDANARHNYTRKFDKSTDRSLASINSLDYASGNDGVSVSYLGRNDSGFLLQDDSHRNCCSRFLSLFGWRR